MKKKKILILLESPGKIKHVREIFNSLKDGNDYTIEASMGHISRICDEGIYKCGIDFSTFEEKYEVLPEKRTIVKKLKAAIKAVDLCYCASDGDNEGEAIAFHWKNFLLIPASKYRRIIFKEITEKGIKEGLSKIKNTYDDSIVQSARGRAELDKCIGYRISPLALGKIGAKSAGRVQSAALKILCEKEKEIIDFKPEEFFEIWLPFTKDKKKLKAQYKGTETKKIISFKTKKEAEKTANECTPGEFKIKTITPKEKTINPKDAFTTSTLQQAASSNLGFSPKRTMQIAQKLYESGIISYMRSDSVRLSDEFVLEAKNLIEKNYGKKYYKGFSSVKKGDQDGHEAIRPTDLKSNLDKMSLTLETEQLKLYKLIYNRTIASLMSPAKVKDTEIGIFNKKHKFFLSGREIVFDGFLKVYSEEEEKTEKIPSFLINEKIKDSKLEILKKQTNPPNRFSEAGLIKTLENLGIGRPSTFAPTVEILKDREYVTIEKKIIKPTDLGMRLSEMLTQYFPSIINTSYTAEMENMLDRISSGKTTRVVELKKFWEEFNPLVLKAQREINKDKPPAEKIGKKCPLCKGELVKRKSKFGVEFIACNHYPKCKYTESVDGTTQKKTLEKTGLKCPKCKKGDLVQRKSSKTNEIFYGCSRYSKGCKFTMKDEEFKKLKKKAKEPEILLESIDKD